MHNKRTGSKAEVDAFLISHGINLHSDTAYSELLERIRPTPRLRRSFLEPYFINRSPSPAHWALAKLVEAGVFRDLYTTNFDNLIEQSIGQLGQLRVVSHEEQAADSGDFEQIPTVYKLHGDYLFDRLANTEAELAHLGTSQAAKLRMACTRGGLIIIGYSGRDKSIMEVLTASAQAGIPLGLYWLAKDGDSLAPMVDELMRVSPSCYVSTIGGFDDFIATVSDSVTRGRSTRRVDRNLTDVREPFVAHPNGVRALIDKVDDALVHSESSIVCISGLPGVGKTTTARRAAGEISIHFSAHAIISAKDRVLAASDIIDECYLQMPISKNSADNMSLGSLVRYLESNNALLLLDNLDGVDGSVLDFLEGLPSPSKALVTVRDIRSIRSRIPHVWEIEHTGLTRDEMAELLELWVRRSPTLGRKIGAATPEEVERLLIASNGWPEAMVMLLTTLSNSLLHINQLDDNIRQDIYAFILGGLYTGLDRPAKACIVWTGNFPVSFTVDGLARVSRASRRSIEKSVGRLIDSHLIKEMSVSQYTWAHPIVREFVTSKSRRHASADARVAAVERFLEEWADKYGGQPMSDWSNFAMLDREFENLKVMMERVADRDRYDVVTRIYRCLFSYIVERGYWTFTEAWCERMVAQKLHKADQSDWLIWWSWIKYYLRRDFSSSATLAEQALALNPRENRQRFEGHRRALIAQGQLGQLDSVTEHLLAAEDLCKRSWSSDSDQAIDLLNSEATAWLGIGLVRNDQPLYAQALAVYEKAERVAARKDNPNTREIGIAMLGQARCLTALGQTELALERAQSSLGYAWRVSWLRGIAEANELVAHLAAQLGQTSLAQSARDVAERMGQRLRSSAASEREPSA
jgi:hypothetical protein